MRIFISLSLIATLICGCRDFEPVDIDTDSSVSSSVTVLEDGRLLVQGSLSNSIFGEVSVDTRAVFEEDINDGWCLIFGEDATEQNNTGAMYTDDSPLLEKIQLTINSNKTFFVTLDPYEGIAFLRIVVNLTDRENTALESVVCWADCDGAIVTSTTVDANKDGYYDNTLKVPSATDISGATITDTDGTTKSVKVGTFGDYRYQSVGLDGIYDMSSSYTGSTTWYDAYLNTETLYDDPYSNEKDVFDYINNNSEYMQPDPTSLSSDIPMSSIGFVLDDISNESIASMFDTTIQMIRTCSKVDVTVSDKDFTLYSVYMIDCAQESRVRSTVLSSSGSDGSEVSTSFDVPIDLGGSINYLPLVETKGEGETTTPIYIYPNSGGNYDSNGGVVDQDINPQYVIIKGHAADYDTDGYYKIALKAQYPIEYDEDSETGALSVKAWSDLTYDILRNCHFNINLKEVNKPGYKTLVDAMNPNNPATNISYSITIMSENSSNEILVSNGTYYIELQTTRVFMKGYGSTGNSGSVIFTAYPNNAVITDDDGSTTDENGNPYVYYHPAIYVQADYDVTVDSCYAEDANDEEVTVTEINLSDDTALEALFNADADLVAAYGTYTAFKNEFYNTSDEIKDVWYKIPASSSSTEITVNFSAEDSGRIRLRIGDMLKFIPVYYESPAFAGDSDDEIEIFGYYFPYSYLEPITTNTGANIYDSKDTSTTTDYSWFTASGGVTQNDSGAERELRAMIYPENADGITKLYFKQSKYEVTITNPNEKTDANTDDIRDGNIIDMGGVTITDANGNTTYSDEFDGAEDVAVTVISMFETGYTTIYFEDKATTALLIVSNGYSTFELIDDIIAGANGDDAAKATATAALKADGYTDEEIAATFASAAELGSDYTYSVDLTDASDSGDTFFKDIGNEAKYNLFAGVTTISSITLPGIDTCAKIDDSAFEGCTNLEYVVIGAEGDYTQIASIGDNAFDGCTSLISVTIYTSKNSISYTNSSFSSSGLASKYGSSGNKYPTNKVVVFD